MKPSCLLLLLSALCGLAAAMDFQSVASIREAALSTVPDREGSGVRADARVDTALRLPACAEALEAHAGNGGIAEVSCSAAGWKLYVPVSVQRLQAVLVLARPLMAGETVAADSLRTELRDVGRQATGSLADPAQAVGRVARRSLMAGAALSTQDLIAPRTVHRGDTVTLIARHGGMEVRASGRALADAGRDERLNVENLSSRRTVQGILQDNGEVLVQ